jgi:hypothetical protein
LFIPKGGVELKAKGCVWVSALLLAWLPATGNVTAQQDTKPKKEIVKPVKDGVRVYTSSRVWIGEVDKDADVEVLLKTAEWCKVQYTQKGTRFVGWVRRDELALADNPPPTKEEDTGPKILSVEETSEELRKLVIVGIDYKTSRGEGWDPKRTVGVRPTRQGNTTMKLRVDDKGMPAKLVVLARFRRDHVIELYVENKIVKLKQFRNIANPAFDRIIASYIRALEAYNEGKIPDFKSSINSAERFWETIEAQME